MQKKLLINSFILAFILSLLTTIFVFPQLFWQLYMDITNTWKITLDGITMLKLIWMLWWQTSIIWAIFYSIAKKSFNQ